MNTTNGMQDNDPTIVIVAALDASEQHEEQRGMKRKVEEKGGASGVDHDHENKNELTPAFQEKDGLNTTGTSTGTGTDDGDTMLVSEPVSKEKRTIDENGRSSSSSSSIGGEDDNDTNNLTIDPDESNLPEGMRLVWNAKKTGAILYIAKNMNNKDNDLSSCISTEHLQNDNNNNNATYINATTNATITTVSTTNNRELRVCLVGRAKCVLLEGAAEILGYDLENNTNVVDDDDDYDDDPNQTQNLDRRSHNHHTDRSQTDNPSSSSLASVSLSSSSGVTVTSPYWSSWMTIEANPRLLPCRIALLCIRGYESFKLVPPTRPIVLPSSWRTCADQFVQECTPGRGTNNNNNNITNNKNNYPTDTAVASTGRGGRKLSVVADYLEDYDDDDHHRRENHNQPSKKQCMMILGAKSTGKSTFLRYVTNRLLSSSSSSNTTNTNSFNSTDSKNDGVAILDTDVGCGELAPPGLLRLAIVRKPLLRPPYWNLIDEDTVQNDQQNEKQRTIDDRVVNKDKNDKNKNNNDNDNDNNIGDDEDNENNNGIQVVSSVFFGSNTSKVDPTRYINAVQFLMDKYETEIVQTNSDRVPLLINMDGWVKGLGYQILTALIENLQPTHLVQIIGESKGQTFEIPMNLSMNPHIYKIPACQSLPEASLCRIPPLTMRNFRWAAYFLPHQLATFDAWDFVPAKELQTGWIVATNSDGTTTVPCSRRRKNDSHDATGGDHNNAEIPEGHEALRDECRLAQSLAKEKPYCVPMESVEAFVIGSDFEDHLRIPPNAIQNTTDIERTRTRIFQALNGSIVALCIDTITMESLGYGILRSIDWNQRLLYVLVPPSVAKTRSSLSQVKALVGGNLQLPLAMLYRGVYAESFPYLTTIPSSSSSIILGSAPMKSRNNIARRGLV